MYANVALRLRRGHRSQNQDPGSYTKRRTWGTPAFGGKSDSKRVEKQV